MKKNVEIPFDFLWICNSKLRITCVNYYWFRLRFTLHNLKGHNRPFLTVTRFIIAYHISLVKVQTNYCNKNPLILGVKQLNKIVKCYYFHTLKALWDGQGKIKMYYGMSRVKKQLSGKRSINVHSSSFSRLYLCTYTS